MIRVVLPYHLKNLAAVDDEVTVAVIGEVTRDSVLDALESLYPMLRGTIRDHQSKQRRPYIRFFACQQDWSFRPGDEALPAEVAEGREPFLIVGAIVGG
ncbi:MoaD/ThiS family protein [Porticoccus sp. W117]|uniref:MoaD/ThiS family protein n=1 Tax=Porticoccus sp. W117 TaxID=3054777 RepID=UPI0025986D1C|nr:MoaD/ThiS family protein [Porticoccus sp. W117]MDM3870767.1 MoaD/ThiS family protein [Porticoccus sp. W117]